MKFIELKIVVWYVVHMDMQRLGNIIKIAGILAMLHLWLLKDG